METAKNFYQITYMEPGDSLPRSVFIESTSVLDAINECELNDLDAIIRVERVPAGLNWKRIGDE